MLRELVCEHRDLVEAAVVDLVVDALDAQLPPLLADVRRAGKTAFERKPRELVRVAPPRA